VVTEKTSNRAPVEQQRDEAWLEEYKQEER
jgi:hypothetical protein